MPHSTTKTAPAKLIFPNHKFHTCQPGPITLVKMDCVEIFQCNYEGKMQMKKYTDDKQYVKTSDIQVADLVLVHETRAAKQGHSAL